MTLRSLADDNHWDQRNAVPIRRLASVDDVDHKSAEPYEFIMPAPSGGALDIVALYLPKPAKTLIVTFHGSLLRSKYQLPRFEWRKSLSSVDAAQLFVADSTLHLNSGIALGWYVGNAEQNFTTDLADMIKDIAVAAGYERILLTGSSGGGFASLAISRQIPGSLAVCFSPQTRVGDYLAPAVATFCRVSFPGNQEYAQIEGQHRSRLDLRHLYSTTPDTNFVRYVQNTRDTPHFDRHYSPFARERGVEPTLGGLDAAGRIEFVPQPLQPRHEPPSRGRFRTHILEAHSAFLGGELDVLSD